MHSISKALSSSSQLCTFSLSARGVVGDGVKMLKQKPGVTCCLKVHDLKTNNPHEPSLFLINKKN